MADHCASSAGRTAIPWRNTGSRFTSTPRRRWSPASSATLASQMDVAPTLFGLLRFRYASKFFGRDILDSQPSAGRALLSTYQQLGYLKDDKLTVLSPGRRIEVFSVNPETGKERRVPSAQNQDGIADAISYYQTASYAFLHRLVRWPDEAVANGRETLGPPPRDQARNAGRRRSEHRPHPRHDPTPTCRTRLPALVPLRSVPSPRRACAQPRAAAHERRPPTRSSRIDLRSTASSGSLLLQPTPRVCPEPQIRMRGKPRGCAEVSTKLRRNSYEGSANLSRPTPRGARRPIASPTRYRRANAPGGNGLWRNASPAPSISRWIPGLR